MSTKNTTETFRANATIAFASSLQAPTAYIESICILGNSNTTATQKFMQAQIGAK